MINESSIETINMFEALNSETNLSANINEEMLHCFLGYIFE